MNLPALLLFILSLNTQAIVLSENFSTVTQLQSSTAIWNFATGFVHPSLHLTNYQVGVNPVVPSTPINVGNGSDGDFNSSTYANFGTVVGFLITIDASVHPVLNFTNFQLDNGYTLTSINGPLIIYSLSNVLINGIIECSGQPGSPATTTFGGLGGQGRCGGQNGGFGGNISTSGTQGFPFSGLATGGIGGSYIGAAPGSGGGGGGAYSGNPGSPGTPSAPNVGGLGGGGSANDDFTDLSGSPGGGGGSGSNTEGGGGGGGGGGSVIIHAVGDITISATGFILARGGLGGNAVSGGAGGGGGGGSIKIFSAGNIHLNSGIPVDVSEGVGGISTGGPGNGGLGSFGRTWLNYSSFSGAGAESHPSGLTQIGSIEYQVITENVVSKTYDTSTTLALYQSITSNPASPDIVLEVAGSNDNFTTDDSGWLPSAQISNLNNKRYLRFKILLTNSNALTPTKINDVFVTYDLQVIVPPPSPPPPPVTPPDPTSSLVAKSNFQFKSGCGLTNTKPISKTDLFFILLLTGLPLFAAFSLKLKTFNT